MNGSNGVKVCIKARSGELELALARTLADAFGESVVLICDPNADCRSDIVVTTDAASSPTEVSDMTDRGEQVVVLAALPNDIAEASYRHAGAREYLPMVAAVAPLIAAVGALLTSLAGA